MQKRRFLRFPSDIPIRCQISSMIGEHHHLLKDAGCGGLCFHASGWIEPGTRIKVCIPGSDAPCRASGKVAWCRKDEQGRFLMGIAFDHRIRRSDIRQLNRIERIRKRALSKGVRFTGEELASRMGMPALH